MHYKFQACSGPSPHVSSMTDLALPTNIGQGSRKKFSLGQRSIQHLSPQTSSGHCDKKCSNISTGTLALCNGFKLLFFPPGFPFCNMKRWEWKIIKGKAHHHEIFLWQTQGQFCPTTQPQKQGHTNTSWSAQGGVLGTSLYAGKGRCVCMMGITEHVPQKTQRREALQKAFHLPHPKLILS